MPPVDLQSGSPDRPLRADAERNRQLVLDAARSAFAEHGLGVRLDEIAARAGVGIATVYRRFKDKDALVMALFEQQIGEVVAVAEEALAHPGGTGLRWFFEQTLEAMASDRGLQQILTGVHSAAEQLTTIARREIEPRLTELLRRAQAGGTVRADLVTGDLPMIQLLLTAVIDATAPVNPELHRRYAFLLLDALLPGGSDAPLREPAPSPDEGVQVVEAWRPSPRRPGARG